MLLDLPLHGGNQIADPDTQTPNFKLPEPFDKSTVADLSESAINRMTREELIEVIRAADLTDALHSDFEERLQFYDRPTLSRMAYLGRQCCRNQGY